MNVPLFYFSGVCPEGSGYYPAILNAFGFYQGYCQGFTDVPSNIPRDTIQIYLAGNQIKSLKANSFNHTSCTALKIIWDELEFIEAGAFNNLDSLSSLCLFNNKIKYLPPGLFSGLSLLSQIQLQNNYIKTLPSDLFPDTPNILSAISGNPLVCDTSLCSVYKAEREGHISWMAYGGESFGPQCTDLYSWPKMSVICGMNDERGMQYYSCIVGLTFELKTLLHWVC